MQQILQEKVFNIPNVLTLTRIVLLPVVAWCFRMGYMAWAFFVYLLAMLTDAFDGAIARRTNQITVLGKLLDPIADKLSLLTLLGLFVIDGQIPPWVLILVLIKETLLIVGSLAALKLGIVVHAQSIGKITTAAFMVSIAMHFLHVQLLADMTMYLSIIMSIAALLWYSRRLKGQLQQMKDVKIQVIE